MADQAAPSVRMSELMAALSLATDIGMAQPLESGLATCLAATALAERLGLADVDRGRVHHLALLQHVGCTAASTQVAQVMGDELLMREHARTLDFADRRQTFAFLVGHVARAYPAWERPAALGRALARGGRITASVTDVCEAADLIAAQLGYGEEFRSALACVMEYWDGGGFPGRAAGEQIPVTTRVVQVATLAVAAHHEGGVPLATRLVGERSGHTLGTAEAAAFLADPTGVLRSLESSNSVWDDVVERDPDPRPRTPRSTTC